MSKDKSLLERARREAEKCATWADLQNFLFDQHVGLLAKAYPRREDREKFVLSDEFKAIRALIRDAQKRTGLVQGATPEKSGKFLVRVPKSLHAALDSEATAEGVSLNQLVLTKLAIQLEDLTNSGKPEMAKIARAYIEVRNGYSIDRVVADPDLNLRFLDRCRKLGVRSDAFEINWRLLNGRKNKELCDLPKTQSYTPSRSDEFAFASEMALRYLQNSIRESEGIDLSLDKIMCDPDRAAEFDAIAQKLAPGFTPLEYRWVAFGIRKAAGRYRSRATKAKTPSFDLLGRTSTVRMSSIPREPGIYLFKCDDESLFVGETDDLRGRLDRHFERDKSGIPDWLYDCGKRHMTLGIFPTPTIASTERKVAELSTIFRLKPVFNLFSNEAA